MHLLRPLSLAVVILGTPASDVDAFAHSEPAMSGEGCSVVEDYTCKVATPNYGDTVCSAIRKHWLPPTLAQRGERGAVTLHFYIGRDGDVIELTTVREKGFRSMELAAREAVMRAMPFPPPVFVDPQCERLGVTFNFFYNMGEKARARWLQKGRGASTP